MKGCFATIALASIALAACGKRDNASGTYAEDGREIAKTGNYQGQETHGYVGTTDQVGSSKPGPAADSAEPQQAK